MFTGNKEIFKKISAHLHSEGFNVEDAIHLGDDVYEFTEKWRDSLGCYDQYCLKGWVENDEVKYKKKVVGSYCVD